MASSTSSIGGLVSGLDTASIISSLMQLEAKPQTLLKTRLSTETTNLTSLQSLNAAFAALGTKAAALSTTASWSPLTTTSSSTSVTASAGATGAAGTLDLTVVQTAVAHALSFTQSAARTDVVTSGGPEALITRADGTTVPLDTGDGTLAGLVSAVNRANAGFTASTVKLDDGTYRLRVVATTTGDSSAFTLTNADGSDLLGGAVVTAGRDAAVTVGGDTIHSATNTFSDLVTGLDVTVAPGTAAGTAVTITTARNASAAQASVQDLVDSANAILTQIDKLTSYDATTQKSGALAGDATVRDLRNRVLDTVTRASNGASLSGLGIDTDRSGKITFDATRFASAYASDPAGVADRLGATSSATEPGWAARLAQVSTAASDSGTGVLTASIEARQSTVKTMQRSIDDWDVRLEDRKAALEKTYTDLETSLRKLQSQSSYLTSQLSSLSSSSSDS